MRLAADIAARELYTLRDQIALRRGGCMIIHDGIEVLGYDLGRWKDEGRIMWICGMYWCGGFHI